MPRKRGPFRLRDGTTVEDPRLDRIAAWDGRNENYLIRSLATPNAPDYPLRGYTWAVRYWLDQQRSSGCVGHAYATDVGTRPAPHDIGPPQHNPTAYTVYWFAQYLDWWPGGEWKGASPQMGGTSVLHGAQACQRLGFFTEYRWATTVEELAVAIGYFGPAIGGFDWHAGMMSPDEAGFVHRTGAMLGGHAICIPQVNVREEYFGFAQSWGDGPPLWKISFADMALLLDAQGEACIPVNRSRRVALPTEPIVPTPQFVELALHRGR